MMKQQVFTIDDNEVVTMETGIYSDEEDDACPICSWRLLRGKTCFMAAILSFIITTWRCVSVTTKLCACVCVCACVRG